MLLSDGTFAAVGMTVVAVGKSGHGNYDVGDTGVICRLQPNDPIVRWDRTGEEHSTTRARLKRNTSQLADGTFAAVGMTVVAVGKSGHGNYDVGDTGVICRLRTNSNDDPIVRWDGTGEEHSTTRARLKRNTSPLEHLQSSLGFDLRTAWQSADRKGEEARKLFAVAPATREYREVASAFGQTLHFSTVDKVERIENGFQHEQHALQLVGIKKHIGAAWNENKMHRLLFHGTQAVESIVNDPIAGFRPLLAASANGARYGDGTYFARDAAYSDSYARQLPNGQKQMLVASVVVGRCTTGRRGMKICPTLPGEQFVRYDSLVDSYSRPKVFVVQHSSQAYPAYLITYH